MSEFTRTRLCPLRSAPILFTCRLVAPEQCLLARPAMMRAMRSRTSTVPSAAWCIRTADASAGQRGGRLCGTSKPESCHSGENAIPVVVNCVLEEDLSLELL
jgi:hypothetical protein